LINHKILEYVDDVMSRVSAPDDFKLGFENKLIRQVLEICTRGDTEKIEDVLGSPQKLADQISGEMLAQGGAKLCCALPSAVNTHPSQKPQESCPPQPQPHQCKHAKRYAGEFMHEDSNVNIKLLYIPLIQVSSGTQRITRPIYEDEDDD
jgi:hypothetical protein